MELGFKEPIIPRSGDWSAQIALENALAKLDKYHLLVLHDVVYVNKDQAETSVLFELVGSRYERRSI